LLHARYAFVSTCELVTTTDAPARFLSRVCDLRIIEQTFDAHPLDPTDVARVLRAAPQLKKFHICRYLPWLAPTAPTHPTFEGLVHPRLRQLGLAREEGNPYHPKASPPAAEWAAHLRRRHFPRLRELVVGDETHFVTPPDFVLLESRDAAAVGERVVDGGGASGLCEGQVG
jgi:hypothetical protein